MVAGTDSEATDRRTEAAESPRSTSAMLAELRDRGGGEKIGLGEIAGELRGGATGILLLALALPEMIPMIGLSALLAAPIFVIGAYMAWTGSATTVPGWVKRRSLPREKVEKAIERSLPALRWLDRVSRPRWIGLAGATRVQGVACMLLALVLTVPIPGVNIVAAFGVGGIGIGMLQRDGAVVAGALACTVLAVGGAVLVFTGAAALIF